MIHQNDFKFFVGSMFKYKKHGVLQHKPAKLIEIDEEEDNVSLKDDSGQFIYIYVKELIQPMLKKLNEIDAEDIKFILSLCEFPPFYSKNLNIKDNVFIKKVVRSSEKITVTICDVNDNKLFNLAINKYFLLEFNVEEGKLLTPSNMPLITLELCKKGYNVINK